MADNKKRIEDLEREIAELKKHIATLEEAEEDRITVRAYFDQLFESAPEGIVLADNQGRIIHVSKEFLNMFGYTEEEVIGKDVDTLVASEEYREEARKLTNKASVGEKTALETIRKKKDGTLIHASILASPIVIRNKQVAVYAIYRDITERKKAVDTLKESFARTQKILTATVNTLALAAEKRDPYTAGHQQRVAQLARAIALEMGYSEDIVEGIYLAGIIHDIGKIRIPAEILTKPTTLTELELNIMKTHCQVGYDILKDIDFPWPIAQMILQHHERLNGSGYPQELRSNDIMKEAQILAVADVLEAMSSHRPYRPARSLDATLAELEKNRGILYDTDVVGVCLCLFRKKTFKFQDIHHA